MSLPYNGHPPMKLHRLRTVQQLPVPPEQVWDFFVSPKNLARVASPQLDFQMTNEPLDPLRPGSLLTYRLRPLFGVPLTWMTEIRHMEPPHYFVDEQRFGPYKLWHHQHDFRPIEGGTEVVDDLHYALPLSPLGELAHGLVRRRLEEIFAFRRQVLEAHFGIWTSAGKEAA